MEFFSPLPLLPWLAQLVILKLINQSLIPLISSTKLLVDIFPLRNEHCYYVTNI